MEQEQRWIRRIQRRGSRRDADALVRKYYDEIFAYAFRQVHDRETAFDLTQEIFISVLRSLCTYDPGRAAFRTWLYRAATNKIIDFRRRSVPPAVPLDGLQLPNEQDFAAQIEQKSVLEAIERYVSGLDPGTQQVFRLRLYGEYTFPEIAQLLGLPEAAVKSRYYRLMQTLRKEFHDAS